MHGAEVGDAVQIGDETVRALILRSGEERFERRSGASVLSVEQLMVEVFE